MTLPNQFFRGGLRTFTLFGSARFPLLVRNKTAPQRLTHFLGRCNATPYHVPVHVECLHLYNNLFIHSIFSLFSVVLTDIQV
jgi:hypothetical protein